MKQGRSNIVYYMIKEVGVDPSQCPQVFNIEHKLYGCYFDVLLIN